MTDLLSEIPDIKVILLFRDPRGMMTSRSNLPWCQNEPTCGQIDVVCRNMDEDLKLALELRSEMPNNIYLLRYEDLSLDIEKEVRKLFT